MNLKQAHYIKTIAECGSLTAAAKKLYVSQPSLSQMLRQLEQEIGLPLFDRSVSPIQLTYAGEKYLRTAELILAANEELENQLRDIKREQSGRLRLGISVTRATQVLPLVLPIFSRQYPNVKLEITESGSARLEELLLNGSVDLAMAALESTSTNLAYELIEPEEIGILAGKESRLASRFSRGSAVRLEDTAQDPYVCLKTGHSARLIQDKLFRRTGYEPRILLETDSLEVARRVTLSTGACMLLSNIFVDEYVRQKEGSFYPLDGYENYRHFYACYRKDVFVPRYTKDFIQITAGMLNTQRRAY